MTGNWSVAVVGIIGLVLYYAIYKFGKAHADHTAHYVCTSCHAQAQAAKRRRGGSLPAEIMLWFVSLALCYWFFPFIGIGLIYSIYCGFATRDVCPTCERASLIPIGSPAAQQILTSQQGATAQK